MRSFDVPGVLAIILAGAGVAFAQDSAAFTGQSVAQLKSEDGKLDKLTDFWTIHVGIDILSSRCELTVKKRLSMKGEVEYRDGSKVTRDFPNLELCGEPETALPAPGEEADINGSCNMTEAGSAEAMAARASKESNKSVLKVTPQVIDQSVQDKLIGTLSCFTGIAMEGPVNTPVKHPPTMVIKTDSVGNGDGVSASAPSHP